jgi:hypothetical protein
MSAKDKAKELIDKYQYAVRFDESETQYFANMHSVKECALIAVDELLEFENRVIEEWKRYFEGKGGEMKVERIFWEEVKKEIQLL